LHGRRFARRPPALVRPGPLVAVHAARVVFGSGAGGRELVTWCRAGQERSAMFTCDPDGDVGSILLGGGRP
jgi:hypothetical protein